MTARGRYSTINTKAPRVGRRRERYSSSSISERRLRILTETMRLIDEKGVDGFTILELSARAQVAQKTLYNAYGDKQNIIANAIDHSVNQLSATFTPIDADDIDAILTQLREMCVMFLRRQEFVRATSLLYFSKSLDPRVHASLRSMALRYMSPCLRLYQQRGELLPWVSIVSTENQFANVAHSIVHDWTTGRISDEDFPNVINVALLSSLAAVVVDKLRSQFSIRLEALSHSTAAHARKPASGNGRSPSAKRRGDGVARGSTRLQPLSAAQHLELMRLLKSGARAAGYSRGAWTLPRIRRVIQERLGVEVSDAWVTRNLREFVDDARV